MQTKRTKDFQNYYWLVTFLAQTKINWVYVATFETRRKAREFINDPHMSKCLYKIKKVFI